MGGIFGGTYGETYGTSNLAANAWTHLAATYDGATLRLYVNGTQVSSTARSGTIKASAGPLTIGGDPLYGQYFSGRIDEVRIYNSALTQAQIQTDMATPHRRGFAARHASRRRRRRALTATAVSRVRSISPGRRRPTTSASPATGSSAARARAARTSPDRDRRPAPATTTPALSAATTYRYRVRAADAAVNSAATQHGDGHDAGGAGHAAADGAHRADATRGQRDPDQSHVDGADRQRRGHRLPGRALPGRGLHQLPRDRERRPARRFTDTGLTAATSYSYRVRAVDAAAQPRRPTPPPRPPTTQAAPAAASWPPTPSTRARHDGRRRSGTGNAGTIADATWTTRASSATPSLQRHQRAGDRARLAVAAS